MSHSTRLKSTWHPVAARFVTTAGDKTCQIWCTACTFCYCGTFCHYVVTKRAERSTRCTFCHSFASNTIICLFPIPRCVCVCVCVCERAHVSCVYPRGAGVCAHARARARVCVCACVRGSAHAPACVLLCIVFIIPASISAKLKFCIASSRLRSYRCPWLCELCEILL